MIQKERVQSSKIPTKIFKTLSNPFSFYFAVTEMRRLIPWEEENFQLSRNPYCLLVHLRKTSFCESHQGPSPS